MASLQNIIGSNLSGAGSISTGQNKTKKNYIAMAIINKGVLPALGAGYTNADSGLTGVIVDGQNMATIVKDLAMFNKARWLPNGCCNGSKDETVNLTEGQIYGNDVADATTGEITEMFRFMFKNYYQNVGGLNAIRSNPREFDIVIFTENSVEVYRRADNNVTIVKIADTADGTNVNSRNGTIDFATRGVDGQVEPLEGVYVADLGEASNVLYTLAAGAAVNLTVGTCSGKYARWNRTTTVTLSTLAMTPSYSTPCASFYLYRVVNGVLQPSTGSTYASINTLTGLVTFPAAHTLGAHKYVVQLQNETGIHAEYYLEVNII